MFLVFLLSAFCCAALLLTRPRVLSPARRDDIAAVQASHRRPTQRSGGIAVFLALAAGAATLPGDILPAYAALIAAALPLFVVGLLEDIGHPMTPLRRLAAAAASSLLATALLWLWIERVDLAAADALLRFAPVAILFTSFAVVGVVNAFNLIDGMNGLASGIGSLTAMGLGLVALHAGQADLAQAAFLIAAALLGFLVFNFPFGAIFLGDSGAYVTGFLLAWMSILLLDRVEEASAWAMLLIFFWPVADTFLAMLRRTLAGRRTDQPDRLHFHQFTMRALEILWLGRQRRFVSNPATSVVIWVLASAPVLTGVVLWNAPGAAARALGFYALLFALTYILGIRMLKRPKRIAGTSEPVTPGARI